MLLRLCNFRWRWRWRWGAGWWLIHPNYLGSRITGTIDGTFTIAIVFIVIRILPTFLNSVSFVSCACGYLLPFQFQSERCRCRCDGVGQRLAAPPCALLLLPHSDQPHPCSCFPCAPKSEGREGLPKPS
jgi:hypothetical protein